MKGASLSSFVVIINFVVLVSDRVHCDLVCNAVLSLCNLISYDRTKYKMTNQFFLSLAMLAKQMLSLKLHTALGMV